MIGSHLEEDCANQSAIQKQAPTIKIVRTTLLNLALGLTFLAGKK
jgi:hypothetical protein